ncbi:esterase-like protein [Colletotrichum truncatum]|uniref:Esterase-like protein n=1 Tax=Colletotrichum truncatum TaxID=5467 RepID=A0ACC3YP13_COLTU|nr:esterase-like protein [Colletotrichum truncatum]KAF6791508.1 esterase-like protein [Colletotrichum truncatum]
MSRRLLSTLGGRHHRASIAPETLDRAHRKQNELAAKFERGLGQDGEGNSITINRERKTVNTSAGELPISPVMDPDFAEVRKRWKGPKEKPNRSKVKDLKERARRKLAENPYAHALATPIRMCPITRTTLPSYFLQNFNAVSNPETGDIWIVPEDMTSSPLEGSSQKDGADPEQDNEQQTSTLASQADTPEPTAPESPFKKPMISPPSTYVLSRKLLLKNAPQRKGAGPHAGSVPMLFARRDRFIRATNSRIVFRSDMDEFVLENMRRQVVNAFLYYAKLHETDGRDYLRPCPTWDSVKKMQKRGCLLWIPSNAEDQKGPRAVGGYSAVQQFAAYDVPDAKWEKRLPVHDLDYLLGPDHMATLRKHALFQANSLLLLGKQRSIPVQLYLWKLQGYMAEYPEDNTFVPKNSKEKKDQS